MNQLSARRTARENAFKAAFASTFDEVCDGTISFAEEIEECELGDFGTQLLSQYLDHREQIDELITSHLKGWTLQRLPRVSLTAMRVALSEMLYGDEKIPGVAINEAVELTKKYGAEEDYQFVNGVLGAVVQELGLSAPQENQEPSAAQE